jgi:two-component system chemotaxis sensor kinase CheA
MAQEVEASAEELKAFLQEADEQIQLLDEDFVRLEKEADNSELLQEIFRAAHTVKGSSGMLGLRRMADLTHAMEDTLDKLRKGALAVTAELVGSLLASLYGLKALRDALASDAGEDFDIVPIVERLREFREGGADKSAGNQGERSIEAVVAADREIASKLHAASETAANLFKVTASIDKQSIWASVRMFQVLNDLSSHGEILVSVPSGQEIEQEKAGFELQLVLATEQPPDQIRASVESVEDVTSAAVEAWRGADETGADDQRATEGPAPEGIDRRIIESTHFRQSASTWTASTKS